MKFKELLEIIEEEVSGAMDYEAQIIPREDFFGDEISPVSIKEVRIDHKQKKAFIVQE